MTTEWYPIDTAPRDGSTIIVAAPEPASALTNRQWVAAVVTWEEGGWRHDGDWACIGGANEHPEAVTCRITFEPTVWSRFVPPAQALSSFGVPT